MRLADYIALAFLSIGRQKLRSALTIFAIVIGATSVTIMLAVVYSIRGFIVNQFEESGIFQQVAVSPQTDITWRDKNNGGQCSDCTKLTDALVTKIAARPHVAGVARQASAWQFEALTYGDQKLRLQSLVAYDANDVMASQIITGRDIASTDKTGAVTITSDYADTLGFKHKYQEMIGKKVGLYTTQMYSGVGSDPLKQYNDQQAWFQNHPDQDGRNYKASPVTLTATVVGITNADNDRYTVRVPLAWMRGIRETRDYRVTQAAQEAAKAACQGSQRTQQTPGECSMQPTPTLVVADDLAKNGYNSLIVKADKASNAAAVAKDIRTTFKVGAMDAQTEINQMLGIFNILGYVLGGIGGIALAVAAIGVANTMIMSILERTREIGVMRALGARRCTVSRLFTFEAALLGFLGGVLGILLGYGLILIANPILNSQLASNNITSSNIIALPLWLILGVIGLTTLIGILAGLYPARRASRLDPVEALRYE